MKFLIAATVASMAIAGSAYAQAPTVPSPDRGAVSSESGARGPNTTGAAVPDRIAPSGRPGAPNRPLGYGETNSGRQVNPDRVPPLAPGGQGTAPESR
jgi:hypothetical protein